MSTPRHTRIRPRGRAHGARRATRRVVALVAIAAAALVASGCGDEGPGSGYDGSGLDKPSKAQQKLNYEESMERMRQSLEDPAAPPLQRSINSGNSRQLQAAALRWDQAISIVESIDPPSDIAEPHADLVKAMRELGSWNNRIAKAAPNERRTKQLASQAKTSPAAKAFRTAVNAIEAQGYHVMTPPEDADPFADAQPPG